MWPTNERTHEQNLATIILDCDMIYNILSWLSSQAGGLVSNSDTGRNLKEEETFVYDSPAFSNRDYKWK